MCLKTHLSQRKKYCSINSVIDEVWHPVFTAIAHPQLSTAKHSLFISGIQWQSRLVPPRQPLTVTKPANQTKTSLGRFTKTPYVSVTRMQHDPACTKLRRATATLKRQNSGQTYPDAPATSHQSPTTCRPPAEVPMSPFDTSVGEPIVTTQPEPGRVRGGWVTSGVELTILFTATKNPGTINMIQCKIQVYQ